MRIILGIGILLCAASLGCSPSPPPKMITDAQAKKVCMAFIAQSGIATNRPVLVMEKTEGNLRIFGFITNGVLASSQIVVDKTTGVARLK